MVKTVKPMQVIEKRGFIAKAKTVAKAEKRLPNDHSIPRKMVWNDNNLTSEGTKTTHPFKSRIYDDDRRWSKASMSRPSRKTPEKKSTSGQNRRRLQHWEKQEGEKKSNIFLHCRSSFFFKLGRGIRVFKRLEK